MKSRRLSLTLFFVVVLGALAWMAGGTAFMIKVQSYQKNLSKAHTDAIIVLTGGAGRINAGFDLLHDRLAERMLISGVDARVSVDTLIARWKGGTKPPGTIILGHKAHNTAQNAAEAAEWIAKHNIKSIRLVTTSYHMPRALLEFHDALPGVQIVPYTVPASGPNLGWLFAFTEYNKAIMTWLKLRLLP